jgi:hypothetical protein
VTHREERVALIVGRGPGDPDGAESFETYADYCYSEHFICTDRVWVFELPENPATEIAVAEGTGSETLERIFAAVRALPDVRLIQRLTLLVHAHRDEDWLRRQLALPELTVGAESTATGKIVVHGAALGEALETHLLHEWNHLLKFASPVASAAFNCIEDFEPLDFGDRHPFPAYANDERWAHLGEHLASAVSEGESLLTAAAWPINASVWGKAFGARIASLPVPLRGPHYEFHRRRGSFIDAVVRPLALAALANYGPSEAARTRAILDFLR